jgi:ribosome-associated toxin RatA of RatAB toxin-antitoxin module
MIKCNSILIRAPLQNIFAAASDLAKWPEFLPHYRYNRFISKMPWGGIVRMAAVRTGIPTSWISVYRIDPETRQLQFEHLKSALNATRGMKVIWSFQELQNEVKVEITHELDLKWPLIGGFVAEWIVGWFFIHHIASKTLAGLKKKMEGSLA